MVGLGWMGKGLMVGLGWVGKGLMVGSGREELKLEIHVVMGRKGVKLLQVHVS